MTWAYVDRALVPAEDANVPALSQAFLYGRGVFETFRARRGRPVYRLDRHMARLQAGAAALGIELPRPASEIETAVYELGERCALEDARVRVTLAAGADPKAAGMLVIQARARASFPKSADQRGASAVVVGVRRNETSPLSRVKSLNYLDNILAREAAVEQGADEALLLNTAGLLAEASAANVFVVREGELVTPPLDDGPLPGVTREAVLELAREAGLPAREASVTLPELQSAEEAFLTNSVAGVVPLVSVDGAAIGDGTPGAITRRVRSLYTAAAEGA